MKGKLVVFEGIDNCGKDTILYAVKCKLGHKYRYTIVPSVTPTETGRLIRLASTLNENKDILVPLFVADFYNKIDMIKEALSIGHLVFCNRWITSTMAYCNSTRQALSIPNFVGETIKPDLTIYLKITAEESVRRQKGTPKTSDIYSVPDVLKNAIVRYETFLTKEEFNAVTIDAMEPKNIVVENVLSILQEKGITNERE